MLVNTRVLVTASVAKASASATGNTASVVRRPLRRVSQASAAMMHMALSATKQGRAASALGRRPSGASSSVAPGLYR